MQNTMKSTSLLLLLIMLTGCFASFAQPQPGSHDDTFNPADTGFGGGDGASNDTHTTVVQPDGKILVSGSFLSYNGVSRNAIARTNPDGTLDQSFNPGAGPNNALYTLALQPDGKIIIGGEFFNYNGSAQSYLVRLNADGSLDGSFNIGTGPNAWVHHVVVLPDGKIMVLGSFSSFNGTPVNKIIRLNTDGTLDATFNGVASGQTATIGRVVPQPDGKLLIFGNFLQFNGQPRKYIARLNADGSLDTTFDPGSGANGPATSLLVQPDGKIIMGGAFTSYNGIARNRIVRLNADGSLDPGFDPLTGVDGASLVCSSLQPDGRIMILGQFTSYNGVARNYIARVNPDGSLDESFDPGAGPNEFITYTNLLPDGKILITGIFTSYDGTTRRKIARLNPDGSSDASFNASTGANHTIRALAIQPDGKILIGGQFTQFNGVEQKYLARLNRDGGLDATFSTGPGPAISPTVWVSAIALQPDGKILIGGSFTSYNGTAANRLARLNADGTLDGTFNAGGSGAANTIDAIALQPDGKIIIIGSFTSYNGTSRNRIARVNVDGSLDTSFDPGTGANNTVSGVALQPDGKVLIAGNFNRINGTIMNRIARLNTDGSLDASFVPGTGLAHTTSFLPTSVYTITPQADGKILIAGRFNLYNGVSRNRIARLNENGSLDTSFDPGTGANDAVYTINLQQDGKIVIGGLFTAYNGATKSGIIRLDADGSLDETFDSGTGTAYGGVQASALLPNGQMIIGGSFTAYNGIGKNRITRINGDVIVQNQTITFSSLQAATYGDASFELSATTTSGLAVSYTSSDPTVATVSGSTVTIVGAGATILTASQPGNSSFNAAADMQQTLTVNKASLTAVADNKSKSYGDANPALTITYNGLKGTDDASAINTPPSISTTAVQFSDAGSYPISLSGGDDNNYDVAITDGTLTIDKASLSAKANNKTKTYGDANPVLDITYEGFKSTDNALSIDTPPGIGTTALLFADAGDHPITLSGGNDNNYNIVLTDGTLTVNKAPLSATADDHSKVYGDVTPALTITYNGFKGTDDASTIDTPPTISSLVEDFSDAGTYSISLSGGNDNNYDITTLTEGTFTISKAMLIATAENKTKIYGDPNPELTIHYNGFKGTDDASYIDVAPTISTDALQTDDAGTYPVLLSGGSDNNYNITRVNGTLTIEKANLIATAVEVIRTYGDENPPLSITYTGFIGADDLSDIDTPPVVSTTAMQFTDAGIHSVTVSGGHDNNYDIVPVDAMFVIRRAELLVTVSDEWKTYGEVNPAFSATYDGFKGTDDLSVVTPISINTNATQFSDAGEYLIIGTGGHADNYDISIITGYLTINKALLSVVADNATKTYGEDNPEFTFTYGGFIGTDNISAIDILPAIGTTATQFSDAGTYAIEFSGGSDNNYDFVTTDGVLTIGKAVLTASADDKTKVYGDPQPVFTVTYDGFKGGDDASTLDTPPTISTAATRYSDADTYTLSLSGGSDDNYDITALTDGVLTINKAVLSATADDITKTYGDVNPTLTITYEGFKGSDDASHIDTEPAISTTAEESSDAGTYPIALTDGSDGNYDISLVNGILTVNKATLSVTVNDAETTYGDAAPSFTVVYSGFLAGDDESVIDTPPTPVTTATVLSDAGAYDITLSGGADNNYTMVPDNGTLTITKAAITMKANDQTRSYGESNPTFTITYTGFVNGDDASDIDHSPTPSTTATVLSDVGNYSIILSGGTDNNYTMEPEAGTLTISKAQLIARAHDQSRGYGEANPAFTIGYTGFVNGDNESDLDSPPTASTTATITSEAGEYDIDVSGGTDNNYAIAADPVKGKLTIGKKSQTITFESVSDKMVNDVPFVLHATASSGLAVEFSTASDKVTLNGNQVTIVKAGRAVVHADQSGNDSYNAATRVTNSFCINPLPPVITIDDSDPAAPVVTSSSNGGNQWYRDGIAIDGATSKTYVISQAGSYQVKASVDDCVSDLSVATVFVVTSSEGGIGQANATAYPNPASEVMVLLLNGFERTSNVNISIIDVFGRRVDRFESAGEKEVHVNVRHYAIGAYIIQMVQGARRQQIRFVRE